MYTSYCCPQKLEAVKFAIALDELEPLEPKEVSRMSVEEVSELS